MFIVYVLKSTVVDKSYVGATNDIVRRLNEHNSGRHAYTKRYMPWTIIHSETFQTWKEAREREKILEIW